MQFILEEIHARSQFLQVPEQKPPVPLVWPQIHPALVLIKSVLEVPDKCAGEQIQSLECALKVLHAQTATGKTKLCIFIFLHLIVF